MTRVRRVLNALTVEVAKRKRICYRDRKGHQIEAGASCLVIKEATSAGRKNYCQTCGLEILAQATDDIAALRSAL